MAQPLSRQHARWMSWAPWPMSPPSSIRPDLPPGLPSIGPGKGLADLNEPDGGVAGPGSVIHQGRGSRVPIGSIRRRAAALLYYLVSRPTQTATREQIMEELWPDLVPTSAANSLNQTLYFLRREIDPFYDEDESYEYVSTRVSSSGWIGPRHDRFGLLCCGGITRATRDRLDPDPARIAVRKYAGSLPPSLSTRTGRMTGAIKFTPRSCIWDGPCSECSLVEAP